MKSPSPRPASRGEHGFTLIEVLIVVAIIGLLANIAIPAVQMALRKAKVQSIIADIRVIEIAVHQYYIDKSVLPPDTGPGIQPPALKGYLKKNIRWNNPKMLYKLDWDNWIRADGRPLHPRTNVKLGISVATKDKTLIAMLTQVMPTKFVWTLNNNYTYVIEPIK